jgi:hypothetical protein
MRRRMPLALAGWCFTLSLSVSSLTAQVQASGTSDAAKSPPRHDDWRKVPKALLPPPSDPRQQEILNIRGSWFDKTSLSGIPLDEPQPPRNGGSSGSFWPGEEEIPFHQNQAVVVARFEDYQPYLSPSRLSIYTDIKLSVEQVLEAGHTDAYPGQTVDVLIPGGTVQLSDGRTLSDRPYDPSGDYSLQPGHRYVLFLRYESNGEYFENSKSWELLNGIVVPNRLDEVIRAQEGRSSYSGLSESSFIEEVRKAILQHKQGT